MGTPDFAVPALEAVAAGCDVVRVVTQPDRPRGRGRATGESAVAVRAHALGLAVDKPPSMKSPEVRERLASDRADLFAVVAFGAILSRELLALPRLGCVNLHGSLLPDHRGASPVQRALWTGASWTGVTTLWMDDGIDTGDLILQQWAPIHADDDAGRLASRLAALGAPLLADSLARAHAGVAPRTPQPRASGSYAGKLAKRDGVVDFAHDAVTVWNRARAVTPWPGAATSHGGRRLVLVASTPEHLLPAGRPPGSILAIDAGGVVVACGRGALRIVRLRPEGRADMDAADWARGARVAVGDSLVALHDPSQEAHA